MQAVQFPSQNPLQPVPLATSLHTPQTPSMPLSAAFPGQTTQPNQTCIGQPAQWSWQPPIPVGSQIQPGSQPAQPGQTFSNNFQAPLPPNNFPGHSIMIQAPPITVENPWTTGLFDCIDDPLIAVVACLLPCVTFGQIAEIVDNGSTSCATGALLYGGIQYLIGCPCLLSCAYRTRLRARFNLMESPAPDWITHLFCECCALAQEYRELNSRGYDPAIGWHGNVAKIQSMQHQLALVAPTNQAMRGR